MDYRLHGSIFLNIWKFYVEYYYISFSFFRSRIEKINYRQKEKQVLDDILGKGYDKRIRPSGKNDTGKTVHDSLNF